MTNKERYKQAFSAVQSSRQLCLEVEEMARIEKKHKKNMAVAAAVACALVIGVPGTVYAADIGGIQEKITMWLYGRQMEVEVTENGSGGYQFTYDRGDGEEEIMGYGGVAIDEDGGMTWLSADELAGQINESVSVEEDADGRVWVYYQDQKMDITDLFDENGVYGFNLEKGDRTVYVEVTKNADGTYFFTQTDDESPTSSTKVTTTTMYFEDGK